MGHGSGGSGGAEPVFLMMYPPHHTTPLKFQFPPAPSSTAAAALAATRLQLFKPDLLSPVAKRPRSPSPPPQAPNIVSPMSRISSPSPHHTVVSSPFPPPSANYSPNKKPRPSLYPPGMLQSPSGASSAGLIGAGAPRGVVPSPGPSPGPFGAMVPPGAAQSAFSHYAKNFAPSASPGPGPFGPPGQKNPMMASLPPAQSPLSFGLPPPPPRMPLGLYFFLILLFFFLI